VLAEKDGKSAGHLSSSNVFTGSSNRIQNDLIEATAEVIRGQIKNYIQANILCCSGSG